MATFLKQNNNAIKVANVSVVSLVVDFIGGKNVTMVTLKDNAVSATFISSDNKLTIDRVLEIIELAGGFKAYSVSWDVLEDRVVNG